jgi:hypothetical protein
MDDFKLYSKNNLKILDKDGNIVPFIPNEIQMEIVDYVLECLRDNVPIRIIVLKARQEGVSTVIEALVYWWTATHKHVRSKITAHDADASSNLYDMFKRYYDHTQTIFRPTTKYVTKQDLTFDVTDTEKEQARKEGRPMPGLDSQIDIDTAGSEESGRSETNHWLHGSEVAMWKSGEKLTASLMQTIPMRPKTAIFLESTANGIGDYFHKTWELSKIGASPFKPFFFGWNAHSEYSIPTKVLNNMTAEEVELKNAYNLNPSQLAWRREKMKEFAGDPARFAQEYPINDKEAFLAAGDPRFSVVKLAQMELHAFEGQHIDLIEKDDRIVPVEVKGAPLQVWKQPQVARKYAIGADVAEGVNKDFSVATVMDIELCETVASWRGDIEPAEFGEVLEQLGRWYNNAIIGAEVNNHGLTTVQRMRDLRYPNLFRQEKGLDTRFESQTSKLGWLTNMRTKKLMINSLSEAIYLEKIVTRDKIFLNEAMSYVTDERGRTNAIEGAHDDTVMATAICLQMFEWSDVITKRKEHKSRQLPQYVKFRNRNRALLRRR